jgi:uncharacterized protein (DUF305 family)
VKLIPQLGIYAALLAAAACAPGVQTVAVTTPPPRTDAPADMAHHDHSAMLPASAGPGYTLADVRFMQDMIGHHAQAITMAVLATSRAESDNVLKLARKIDISQRDEIKFMQQWLRERNQGVPDSAQAHAMQMPGMLTSAQMTQLAATRGREFDRLFLRFMIQHHEGALMMAKTLFASPDPAQDSDLFRFATDVVADQGDEIYVMQSMLDMIGGAEQADHGTAPLGGR